MPDVLYIIIPCYNEQEVLPECSKRIQEKLGTLIASGRVSDGSRIVFVDDGSKDSTWTMISALHDSDPHFSGLKLSRNRGHQNALMAGITESAGYADMLVSIDADLQDDINAIDAMVERYYEGCDVVYGVRSSRQTDSFLKRFTAESYYKVIRALGGEVVFNHADYRLISRRAADALSRYGEKNLFVRGLIPMLGFKSATVEYERAERFAGKSKYPLGRMLSLAVDGITSLSARPLRIIAATGILLFLGGALALLFALVWTLSGRQFPGWAVASLSSWGAAGLVTASVGVVGEYVGKIYTETKDRPRYIVDEFLHEDGAR